MRFSLWFAILVAWSTQVQANDDLETLFENASQESIRSNININYQASSLAIVYAEDLKLMGVRTLSEALDFIPGIEVNVTPSGNNRINIRGSNNPNNAIYESTRFYIDGVDIEYIYYANFPIELIERVEVIRGSAIALYGQGSFVGSVNIVTKSSLQNSDDFVSFEYGSYNATKSVVGLSSSINSFRIGVDAHYQTYDRRVDASGAKDTIVAGVSAIAFPRTRESLEGLKEKGIGMSIADEHWRFTSRYLQTFTQNYYGTFGLLDFNEDGFTEYTTLDAQLGYKTSLTKSLKLQSNIGLLQSSYKLDTYSYLLDPNTISPIIKNPHLAMDHRKDIYFTNVGLKSTYFKGHTVDFGFNVQKIKIAKNDYYTNTDTNAQIGFLLGGVYYPVSDTLTKLDGSSGIVNVPGDAQNTFSYYVQDTYSYDDSLHFVLNLRYDDYEFFDAKASYKIASIYSEDEVNIFKAMYSKSYRMPSLQEAFLVNHFGIVGTPSLKPESVQTYEVAYSHLTSKQTFKINLYYSLYKDTIDLYDSSTDYYYNNPDKQTSYGLEIEYSQELENDAKVILNAAYTNYDYINKGYTSFGANTPDASPYTLNAGYILPLSSALTWTNLMRYYSKKELSSSASTIASVALFDTTLHYVLKKDLQTSFRVKNIFDKNYYYPAVGLNFEPMLREGRTLYLSLEYSF